MKIISILISAYKAQDWLEDCLESVYAQYLPKGWKTQVIIGVDGCHETLEFLKKIHYPEIIIIFLKQNLGTYITFNTIMRFAKGDLLCRFDVDDVMKPNFLNAQINKLESDVDMTMTWSIYTDDKLKATSFVMAHEVYHPKDGLNRRGAEGQFIIKHEIWNRLGGFRSWRCGADTDFFKRLRLAGFKHCVIEQFLYLRRTHENSLTAHPNTNFKSPLRLSIQKLTKEYLQQYESGERQLKINPEYAEEYVRI